MEEFVKVDNTLSGKCHFLDAVTTFCVDVKSGSAPSEHTVNTIKDACIPVINKFTKTQMADIPWKASQERYYVSMEAGEVTHGQVLFHNNESQINHFIHLLVVPGIDEVNIEFLSDKSQVTLKPCEVLIHPSYFTYRYKINLLDKKSAPYFKMGLAFKSE